MNDDQPEEWFRNSSSTVWGLLSMGAALAVIVIDAVTGWHPETTAAGLLFALVAYAAFIRTRVGVSKGDFVLHHLFSTVRFPMAALESVSVGRTLGAYAGGRTYVSGAVGRPLREAVKKKRDHKPLSNHADFIEERLNSLAQDARDRRRIKKDSDEQFALAEDVRRSWDWPLIAATAAVAVTFVVLLVL
ncbi:hypothetical protein [Nocardioides panzhihuensis]|uniref:PH domain-containing protein n=1 Tax=Nocardioides panzhihuensis TaxID=860243 RepID=A0A7Z0DH31_9ACTN|nr:hypothetical protein [Nocardioides panzhihuensis]NYI75434.1 hypothetical protein [Nocardioides panzhihuensis]